MTAAEQNAMFDPCFEYDDQSSRQRALGWSEALRGPETALTLSWKNRKVETLTVCNPRALFPRDHTRNAYSLLADRRKFMSCIGLDLGKRGFEPPPPGPEPRADQNPSASFGVA